MSSTTFDANMIKAISAEIDTKVDHLQLIDKLLALLAKRRDLSEAWLKWPDDRFSGDRIPVINKEIAELLGIYY